MAAGQLAIVVGGLAGVAREIARVLAARGSEVAVIPGFATRAEADATFASAAGRRVPGVVVHAHADPVVLEPGPVVRYDDESWDQSCEAPIRRLLFCLQAAHARLHTGGGRIVVVCPDPPAAGAAGRAALTAATSAQRALAMSAARRWAGQRIAVNVVTVCPAVFTGQHSGQVRQAAEVVGGLVAADAGFLTGVTIPIEPS